MLRFGIIGTAFLALAACTTNGTSSPVGGDKREDGVSRSEFEDAMLAPAQDLNLRREEIPELLIALGNPYGPQKGRGCDGIKTEVLELSAVLGSDYDSLTEDEETRKEKLGKEATGFTLNTVEDASTSFIPFRSLVRRATGATAYEKKVRAAYQRGLLRRSYLKGLGKKMRCSPPASPYPLSDTK